MVSVPCPSCGRNPASWTRGPLAPRDFNCGACGKTVSEEWLGRRRAGTLESRYLAWRDAAFVFGSGRAPGVDVGGAYLEAWGDLLGREMELGAAPADPVAFVRCVAAASRVVGAARAQGMEVPDVPPPTDGLEELFLVTEVTES